MKNVKYFLLNFLLMFAVALLLQFLYYITGPHISEDEKELHRYWYLCNHGDIDRLMDDKKNAEDTKLARPVVGVDTHFYFIEHDLTMYKAPVTIALIDTGIADFFLPNYRYLWVNKGEIANDGIDNDGNGYIDDINGFNFCENNGNIAGYSSVPQENDHGTMCTDIIRHFISLGDSQGSKEPAIKTMPLKVLNKEDAGIQGEISDIIRAIEYAEDNGARVCNLSLSLLEYSEELYNVMARSDMLFVVSTGNDIARGLSLDERPLYPAAYDLYNIIAVTNLNYNGLLNKSANYGRITVDIAAPGTDIRAVLADGIRDYATGSSFAAPMVSSAAAIVWMINPDLSAAEVKDVILDSAEPMEDLSEKTVSGGMLNIPGVVEKALESLK